MTGASVAVARATTRCVEAAAREVDTGHIPSLPGASTAFTLSNSSARRIATDIPQGAARHHFGQCPTGRRLCGHDDVSTLPVRGFFG